MLPSVEKVKEAVKKVNLIKFLQDNDWVIIQQAINLGKKMTKQERLTWLKEHRYWWLVKKIKMLKEKIAKYTLADHS